MVAQAGGSTKGVASPCSHVGANTDFVRRPGVVPGAFAAYLSESDDNCYLPVGSRTKVLKAPVKSGGKYGVLYPFGPLDASSRRGVGGGGPRR